MVLRAGIEPACPFEREILSLLCLPISPPEQELIILGSYLFYEIVRSIIGFSKDLYCHCTFVHRLLTKTKCFFTALGRIYKDFTGQVVLGPHLILFPHHDSSLGRCLIDRKGIGLFVLLHSDCRE